MPSGFLLSNLSRIGILNKGGTHLAYSFQKCVLTTGGTIPFRLDCFVWSLNILPNADALFVVKTGSFAQLTPDLLLFAYGFLGAKLEFLIEKAKMVREEF